MAAPAPPPALVVVGRRSALALASTLAAAASTPAHAYIPLPSDTKAGLFSSFKTDSVGKFSDYELQREGYRTPNPGAQGNSPGFGGRSAQGGARQGAAASGGVSVGEQVAEIQRLTREAREDASRGDYEASLAKVDSIVKGFPDLTITEYSRVARALLQFQLGNRDAALLGLQDEAVAIRGVPEVQAALACVLWDAGRANAAESAWERATALDGRYSNPAWVRENKHWPPAMVTALESFLSLTPPSSKR